MSISTTESFLFRIKKEIQKREQSVLQTRFSDLNSYNYEYGRLDGLRWALENIRDINKHYEDEEEDLEVFD